jgi:phage-related minor tail protein
MEVSAAMASAGASKEEIEEMMQMILNRGGGISDDFIESIKEAMASGISPFEKLNALKAAMEEEMNSVTNALRNTFINRIPTPEEIAHACNTLAEKLAADAAARTDVKLALVDVLDEALQGKLLLFDYVHFPIIPYLLPKWN